MAPYVRIRLPLALLLLFRQIFEVEKLWETLLDVMKCSQSKL